ncbi:MAG: hypothetical protein AAFY20_08220, partial [Cyanobacteria bacterium J06639_14]
MPIILTANYRLTLAVLIERSPCISLRLGHCFTRVHLTFPAKSSSRYQTRVVDDEVALVKV